MAATEEWIGDFRLMGGKSSHRKTATDVIKKSLLRAVRQDARDPCRRVDSWAWLLYDFILAMDLNESILDTDAQAAVQDYLEEIAPESERVGALWQDLCEHAWGVRYGGQTQG